MPNDWANVCLSGCHSISSPSESQVKRGAPASIGEALKSWLEQYDAGDLWPLVQAALNDERLLLVVDGLDEWVNDEAGAVWSCGAANLRAIALNTVNRVNSALWASPDLR